MAPGPKVRVSDCRKLDHQNSSAPWPVDESEKMARAALRGKEIVFVALAVGMLNAEGEEALLPIREDMGIIISAGPGLGFAECVEGIVRYVAVNVVLYTPVKFEVV